MGALLPGTFYFARHFILKDEKWWQVAGGRWQVEVRYIFLPGTFYENIKSAWESAKVNDTFCQTLFTKILKVLLNFDNKCPR